MGQFKTSAFGGYNKKQIDEIIEAQNARIAGLIASESRLNSEIAVLKSQLENSAATSKQTDIISDDSFATSHKNIEEIERLKSELDSANAGKSAFAADNIALREQLSEMKAALLKKDEELQTAQITSKNVDFINIGRVYLRAYESGAEVTREAKEKADAFLAEISATALKAREEISAVTDECEKIKDEVALMNGHLCDRVGEINSGISDMTKKAVDVSGVFDRIDEIRRDAEKVMNRKIDDYKQISSEFIRNAQTERDKPASVPVRSTAFTSEKTAEQSVPFKLKETNPSPLKQPVSIHHTAGSETTSDIKRDKNITEPTLKVIENEEKITAADVAAVREIASSQVVPEITNPDETVPQKQSPFSGTSSYTSKANMTSEERKEMIREALLKYSQK